MGICAGKPATKTSADPSSQVEAVDDEYQVNSLSDTPCILSKTRIEHLTALNGSNNYVYE